MAWCCEKGCRGEKSKSENESLGLRIGKKTEIGEAHKKFEKIVPRIFHETITI